MSKQLIMYDTDEKLILTESVGKEDTDRFIKAGTEVTFVKFVRESFDLEKSMIAFKHGDRTLVVSEDRVKVKNQRKVKKILKQINKDNEKRYPRTRMYSSNILKRYFFRIYYYIVDRVKGVENEQV